MKAAALSRILAPFAQLANRHALSNVYRALYVQPDKIQGCSPWGILEADVSLGIETPFWIDAANFIAVIRSLPDDDLELQIAGGGLSWSCGLADGKLALLGDLTFPETDWSLKKSSLWEPTDLFTEALQLGSLSCGPLSMASAGVYGAVVDNRNDELLVLSSDNVTVAACGGGKTNPLFPGQLTFSPDALNLLVAILKTKAKKPVRLNLTDTAVHAFVEPYSLMLRPAAPLKHDLAQLTSAYRAKEVVAEIPRERIAAFIKRAASLSEEKQHTYVVLRVAEGALSLSFAEGTAASDEYYMVDGLEIAEDIPEIRLDAIRVARVLAYADKLALDHIERHVLVFFGTDPNFDYLVRGIQTKG